MIYNTRYYKVIYLIGKLYIYIYILRGIIELTYWVNYYKWPFILYQPFTMI